MELLSTMLCQQSIEELCLRDIEDFIVRQFNNKLHFCIEANPAELEANVLDAAALGQTDQVEGYLCAALKALKVNRLKPDPMLYLTMVGLAKEKPELFLLRSVTEVGIHIIHISFSFQTFVVN